MQVVIQAAMAVVRVMREADLTTEPHTISSLEEPHRLWQAVQMLGQPAFDRKAPDRYVELLNFKMKVANELQAKA